MEEQVNAGFDVRVWMTQSVEVRDVRVRLTGRVEVRDVLHEQKSGKTLDCLVKEFH